MRVALRGLLHIHWRVAKVIVLDVIKTGCSSLLRIGIQADCGRWIRFKQLVNLT
jgi:hypothetical protein